MLKNKNKFFFDTANVSYIKEAWSKLSVEFQPEDCVGITTNPNAFLKENLLNLSEWETRTKELVELLSSIRDGGVIYVQLPSCDMYRRQIEEFAKKVKSWGDSRTKIGLKIPPYGGAMLCIPQIQEIIDVNVTGLSDCSTALKCVTHGVNYISVIPGRMEEVGIDANRHIAFIMSSNLGNTKVITGSMRTLECLERVCKFDTIPTIGAKVFDIIFKEIGAVGFKKFWSSEMSLGYQPFSPLVEERAINLSEAFFKQMNTAGEKAFLDFKVL